MPIPGFRRFAFLSPVILLAATSLYTQPPSRIAGRLDNARRVALAGRVHRNARPQNDLGRVDPGFQMPAVTLFLKPGDPGQASLNQLLQDQQDPASPNFHHWLTPEEYADRF